MHSSRSPFFVIATLAIFLVLIPGVFRVNAQQFPSSNASVDDQDQMDFRQCMSQALDARESIWLQAYQEYFTAFTQAYDVQSQQMNQAWQIADLRSRNEAFRDAKRTFNLAERTLRKERSSVFRDADRQYSAARRECNDALRNARTQRRRTGGSANSSFSYSSRRSSSRSSMISERQNIPFEQTEVFDQTSYYDALLRQAQAEQQLKAYQRTGSVSSAYGQRVTETNARCGDGICQAGEQGYCVQDCMNFPISSSAARLSTASAEWDY